ncbi:MAG: hypothetical protein ACKOQP_02235, partial [Bacteroidota bacterium]
MSYFHSPKILRRPVLVLLGFLLLQSACTVQKKLNEGEVWLRGYRVQGVTPIQARAMEKSLKPVLNRRALGLFPWRTHAFLGLNKGQTTRFRNALLTRFAEAPVLSNQEGMNSKAEYLRKTLMDQGFLRASVRHQRKIGPRGALETFFLEPGPGYVLGRLDIQGSSPDLIPLVQSLQRNHPERFPRPGEPYQA